MKNKSENIQYYVPIIRIFGIALSGQKCCLHIHNVFPYFYIKINKEIIMKGDLNGWIKIFEENCEFKLNDYSKNPQKYGNVYTGKSDKNDIVEPDKNENKKIVKHIYDV